MKNAIKVYLEYIGAWSSADAKEYRITKLCNTVVLNIRKEYRVGDVIDEETVVLLIREGWADVTTTSKGK